MGTWAQALARRYHNPWGWVLIFCLLSAGFVMWAGEGEVSSQEGAKPPEPAGYRIVINIPAFTLYLYQGDRVVRAYPIAVGTMFTPSLVGEYTIVNKIINPTWYPKDREPVPPGPENPLGTRWLGLSIKGYGIHGNNNPDSIGKAVSGGCIRMRNQDVEELFGMVSTGTPVDFTYETIEVTPAPGEEWFWVTVYPDIYQWHTTTMFWAREKLRLNRIPGPVDEAALAKVLAMSSGRPEQVGTGLDVEIDGQRLGKGFLLDGGIWLPLSPVLERLGIEYEWTDQALFLEGQQVMGVAQWGERAMLPLGEVARILRLEWVYRDGPPRVNMHLADPLPGGEDQPNAEPVGTGVRNSDSPDRPEGSGSAGVSPYPVP